jgi:hypothetical protein
VSGASPCVACQCTGRTRRAQEVEPGLRDVEGLREARVRIMVQTRGREATPGICDVAADQKREWLWRGDFEAFINTANAAPTYDAVAQSFQDHFEHVKLMGVAAAVAVTMSVFVHSINPAYLTAEELRWTVYLCGPDCSMLHVVNMSRETLAMEYANMRMLEPWPDIRKEVSWQLKDRELIELEIDELDIANRSLELLLAMCEHKNKNQCLSPAGRLAAGAYNVDRSLIVQLTNDPGGVPAPAASGNGVQDLVDAAGVAAGVRHSDDEDDDDLKTAKRISLLAEVTTSRSLKDIDEAAMKLIDQQREDEERRTREDEPSEPDWDPDEEDKDHLDSGAALGQISRELEARQIWKAMVFASIHVNTCWNLCNRPDGSGWRICPPHLVDAYVIDVPMFRRTVAEACEVTLMCYDDTVNNIMPPHCRLIGKLHEYA